jgi:hypothetical protein
MMKTMKNRTNRIGSNFVTAVLVILLIFCLVGTFLDSPRNDVKANNNNIMMPDPMADHNVTFVKSGTSQTVNITALSEEIAAGNYSGTSYVLTVSGTTYRAVSGSDHSIALSSSDPTTVIQYAVTQASGIVYLTAGTYLMSSGVVLRDNTYLVGDGIGRTIIKVQTGCDNFNPFYKLGAGPGGRLVNFLMDGITYDGNYQGMPTCNRNGVVYCDSGSNWLIQNCEFKNEAGSQVIVANSQPSACRNVMIRNNLFTDNNALIPHDGNNIRITGINVSVIDNVIIDRTPGLSTGMDMNIDDSVISGNLVMGCRVGIVFAGEFMSHGNDLAYNNTFRGCSNAIQFWAAGNYRVSNIVIDHNRFENNTVDITGSKGVNSVESNCTSVHAISRHIDLFGMDGFNVVSCTITDSDGFGIKIHDSNEVSVIGSTVTGCEQWGIYATNTVNFDVVSCTIVNNNGNVYNGID